MSDDTVALVAALERVQERPGTLVLFDALAAEAAAAVAEVLAAHPRHPLRESVAAWLAARGVAVPAPPSAAQVCAERGIIDLAEHLDQAQKQAQQAARGIERSVARAERAESLANAYAAVLVVVAAIALLGWGAALDYLSMFEAPPLPERSPATAPVGGERP